MYNTHGPPVACSLLEGNIDISQNQSYVQQQKPLWLQQYDDSRVIKPFGEQHNPRPNYDVDNFNPEISDSYNNDIQNNYNLNGRLRQAGLPSEYGAVMPEKLSLPHFQPPYGYPYPSSGFSAYDAELARASDSAPMAYANISSTIAAPRALIDARDSESIQMGSNPNRPSSVEKYSEKYEPTCTDSIRHIFDCRICKSYIFSKEKIMIGIIFVLAIICIILFVMLMRAKSHK